MKAHLLPALLVLLLRMAQAFPDPRPRPKVLDLALGWLCGQHPKTLTSALDWLDQRQEDWSAEYRLLSQDQWEASAFFAPVLAEALDLTGDAATPIYAAQDDTLIRKRGRKIPGTAYARDPLSPAFRVNLVWGQRFLQTALLVKPAGPSRPWRAIPVAFRHTPPLKPPPRPTPEQWLHDDPLPWQELTVFVAGQLRTLKYKVIGGLCWPKGTQDRPLRLILLKAAGYRLRKGSKLLYRQPAFLLATSTTVDVRHRIEACLARWELEVSFRDEKTVLGVGQAQVRAPQAVPRAPAFLVAAYAALRLVSLRVFEDQRTEAFEPLPAWRPSLRDLIALLRKAAADYVPHGRIPLAA